MLLAIKQRKLSVQEKEVWEKIKKIFQDIHSIEINRNGFEGDITATSHILCSALADIFNLELGQGFCNEDKHYWLKTEHGLIIDVMPVGVLSGPILVDPVLIKKNYYKEMKLNNYSQMQYACCIERVKKAVQEYLRQDHL